MLAEIHYGAKRLGLAPGQLLAIAREAAHCGGLASVDLLTTAEQLAVIDALIAIEEREYTYA